MALARQMAEQFAVEYRHQTGRRFIPRISPEQIVAIEAAKALILCGCKARIGRRSRR
jgi:hypothetical protein